jgi:NAD(P)-dependent dehydrogenase (short-subunit alcohol dehydrogenase family)
MSGKTVLITGGGRGIGAATAGELAQRGWVPIVADVDEEALASSSFETVVVDVLDADACERAVTGVVERHGRLDAVWANAGIASFGPMRLTDPSAWERTIDVNLLGAFRTVRAALEPVIASRGYVAVTASLASFASSPAMSAYCASKAGVEAMCNALRIELAPHGVAVGTIHPTWIDTDMVREAEHDLRAYMRLRAAMRPPFKRSYPVERAARDIADGFDRRARRICTPRFVQIAHVLRAATTTRVFERDFVQAAPEIERLFAEQVSERGRLETSVSERVVNRIPAPKP